MRNNGKKSEPLNLLPNFFRSRTKNFMKIFSLFFCRYVLFLFCFIFYATTATAAIFSPIIFCILDDKRSLLLFFSLLLLFSFLIIQSFNRLDWTHLLSITEQKKIVEIKPRNSNRYRLSTLLCNQQNIRHTDRPTDRINELTRRNRNEEQQQNKFPQHR